MSKSWGIVRIRHKGEFTLPKKLRDRKNLNYGDYLLIKELDNGEICLKKVIVDD